MLGVEVKDCGQFPALLKPEKSHLSSKKETTFQNLVQKVPVQLEWAAPFALGGFWNNKKPCYTHAGKHKHQRIMWGDNSLLELALGAYYFFFIKHPPPVSTSHVRSKRVTFPLCISCFQGWAVPPVWRVSKWIWNQRRQHCRDWAGHS